MRFIFLFVLAAGMGLAGYAAYMVMQQFEGYQTEVAGLKNQLRVAGEGRIEIVSVIVAAENLPFGSILTRDRVREVNWPASDLPENIFADMADLFGGENTPSRHIIRQMDTNEPILRTKVTEFGEDAGLRSRLAPGMRAFAIKVDVASGVSGFLQPGDLIDIYWTGGGRGDETITKIILSSVKLIAIDQTDDEDISRPTVAKTVTVEISPIDVAKLVQAQATGRLTLSLRGVDDTTQIGEIEVNQNDINPNEVIVLEEQRICTRRERRGTEIVDIVVPCPEE